jgi:hypothetical protein
MNHHFAYQCPHCEETISVADDVMGEVVDCPACGSPFKVDVPSARPVDGRAVTEDSLEIDRPDRAEGELKTVHPAMFRTRPFVFIGYWAMILVGGGAMLLALWNYEIISQTFQLVAGGILTLIGGALMLAWWLKTRYTTLTVTTKRTILRKGIIAKNTTEVQHDDVRNIQVDQNMFQRVVGVGELAVSSSGQDDLEIHVDGIPQPDEVAEIIRDLQ